MISNPVRRGDQMKDSIIVRGRERPKIIRKDLDLNNLLEGLVFGNTQ